MTVKISDAMLITVGGGAFNTIENVDKVRRLLVAAGVEDIQLHPLEIGSVLRHHERARAALAAISQLFASGPLPAEHTCSLREDGSVMAHGDCGFGCFPGEPRVEVPTIGDISDGFHTFAELYAHRRALTAVLASGAGAFGDAWRSKAHHPDDGPMFDGEFIVGIDLPTGSIRYHFELEHWDDFAAVPERQHAPKWDGATPDDTVTRLLQLARMAQP